MNVQDVMNRMFDRTQEVMEAKIDTFRGRGLDAVAVVVDLSSPLGRTLSEMYADESHHLRIRELLGDNDENTSENSTRITWNLIVADPMLMAARLRKAVQVTKTEGDWLPALFSHLVVRADAGKAHVAAIVRHPEDPTGGAVVAAWTWIKIESGT